MSTGDVEETAVEYARFHGLTINHLQESLPLSHIAALRKEIPEVLTNDPHLLEIECPLYINTNEQVTLNQGAVVLISEASGNLDSETIKSIVLPLLDIRRVKKHRVEVPLLRSDPESDLLSFAKLKEPRPGDGNLPMEPLDDELNEGMTWPTEILSLPAAITEELRAEKLEITKDMLLSLQTQIRDSWVVEDETAIWETLTTYKRSTAHEPVTPPLLPISPLPTLYIPSSPACHLPLLSDPPSLLGDDLQVAEGVLERDGLTDPVESDELETTNRPSLVKASGPHDTIELLECEPDSPVFARIKFENRKVEVPLMPLKVGSTKFVSFNEYVEEMLLDQSASDDDPDSFFNEAFRDVVESANWKLRQEQLQEADSKNRIDVPVMDFKLPTTPWEQIQQTRDPSYLRAYQKEIIESVLEAYGRPRSWPGARKLDSTLRWTAFPSKLAFVSLDEEFGGETELNTMLGSLQEKGIVDSSGLTWKPLGLRILKNTMDDDDDDLEDGYFKELQNDDVPSLVKKRKIKYDEEEGMISIDGLIKRRAESWSRLGVGSYIEGRQEVKNSIRNGEHEAIALRKEANGFISAREKMEIDSKNRNCLLFGGTFSASSAIDNFLELTASKRQKPVNGTYFLTTAIASNGPASEHEKPLRYAVDLPRIEHQSLPCPLLSPPSVQTPFIVSTTLLKRRSLIRSVSTLFPKAEIIDRDFTAHNTTQWLPNSVTRSPIPSPLASECDVIASPSTGIILTNIRKVAQKPLPGQKAKVEIRDRVERVSSRYERLVVLVSEGNEEETTNCLPETDSLALAEFVGFCSCLELMVVVQFVAGGEETLGKWLVAMMIQYGTQDTGTQLLQDETLWELFLRRAGMNAFAAQAVIAALKAPEGVGAEGGKAGIFGLAAFVEMGPEERIRRFGALLGGSRVLDFVGRCVDTKWV